MYEYVYWRLYEYIIIGIGNFKYSHMFIYLIVLNQF